MAVSPLVAGVYIFRDQTSAGFLADPDNPLYLGFPSELFLTSLKIALRSPQTSNMSPYRNTSKEFLFSL